MRFCVRFGVLLLIGSCSRLATDESGLVTPSKVQTAYAAPQGSFSSVQVAFPQGQAAGDLDVVIVGWNDATSTVTSVADSAGNTYALAIGPVRGTGISQAIYYAPTIKAGSNTVTVTFGTSVLYPDVQILELAGLAANPLDGAAQSSGTGSTASSGAFTMASSGGIIVAGGMTCGTFSGAGSGYTLNQITSPNGDISEYRLTSAAGSSTATAALTSPRHWVFQAVGFSAAPTTTPTWENVAFPTQAGTFTAAFDAVPTQNQEDVVIGLAKAPAAAYTDLAAIVRFADSGQIDVRNGAGYGAAAALSYSAGTSYHVRMVVDVPSRTYSVYVKPSGQSEVTLAQSYAFRDSQSTVTSLAYRAKIGDPGDVVISSFTITAAGDTTAPTVAITAPTAGTTVSGTVTVSASASDNVGVAGVQFLVDGAASGAEDTASPYSISWNTSSVAAGSHTLTARARDAAGNATLSAPITVTVSAPPPPAGTCAQISQWGITWTFDAAYPCGQFVNGDYWVTPTTTGGTVRIVSMSPGASGGRSGWEVNPTVVTTQGFDIDAPGYQASLMPALPYNAAAGSSIIKAISNATGCDGGSGGKTCLTTAAVLTVLGAVPANNGATVFRPPYFGTAKPLFSSTAITWSTLPSLAATSATTSAAPTLAQALVRVQRVQLAYMPDWVGDQIHPSDNFQLTDPYGPGVSNNNADAALRAMLQVAGDVAADRQKVVIALIQYGIDNYGVLTAGGRWISNGGHDLGMRLPIALAGLMLNNASIKSALAAAPRSAFAETDQTYFSPHNGLALWGQNNCNYGGGAEQTYWQDITAQAARVCVDPYGYIDGGPSPGTWYQNCCTSQAIKGSALVVRLVPGLQAVWAADATLAYADRWVTTGAHALPDPCAPLSQGGGPDPAHPGQCILDPDLTPGSTFTSFSCQAGKQCGRFPASEGTSADAGGWRSGFVDAMWSAFR